MRLTIREQDQQFEFELEGHAAESRGLLSSEWERLEREDRLAEVIPPVVLQELLGATGVLRLVASERPWERAFSRLGCRLGVVRQSEQPPAWEVEPLVGEALRASVPHGLTAVRAVLAQRMELTTQQPGLAFLTELSPDARMAPRLVVAINGGQAARLRVQGVDAVLVCDLPQPDGELAAVFDRMLAGEDLIEAVRQGDGVRLYGSEPRLFLPDLVPCRLVPPTTIDSRLRPPVKLKLKGLTIPVFAQVLTRPVTIGGVGLQDSDIELEGTDVPPRACALELTPEGLEWVNLGRCPCTVNGLPLPGRIRLAGGERIVLGEDTTIDIELAESVARAPESTPVLAGPLRHRFRVEVVRGPDRGRQTFLNNPRILVGRLEECQLRLTDPTVSRRHCLVVHWQDAYHLRSLGSKPALINGVPAHDRELKHDDRIQVGDQTELRFVDSTR